jgi:thioredoxin-like negative regulator of GroEL
MKRFIALLILITFLIAGVNGKNFKDAVADGVVVVVFTSKWSDANVDEYIKGVQGHEDAKIITAASEDTKKICKKLRLRNFPSIALFINGDKIEVWKGDMDGIIEVEPRDIKKAIEGAIAGDIF